MKKRSVDGKREAVAIKTMVKTLKTLRPFSGRLLIVEEFLQKVIESDRYACECSDQRPPGAQTPSFIHPNPYEDTN